MLFLIMMKTTFIINFIGIAQKMKKEYKYFFTHEKNFEAKICTLIILT